MNLGRSEFWVHSSRPSVPLSVLRFSTATIISEMCETHLIYWLQSARTIIKSKLCKLKDGENTTMQNTSITRAPTNIFLVHFSIVGSSVFALVE